MNFSLRFSGREVQFNYGICRTLDNTFSAECAFGGINIRKIVLNCDRTELANLKAFVAGNAGHFACSSCGTSLIAVGTGNVYFPVFFCFFS